VDRAMIPNNSSKGKGDWTWMSLRCCFRAAEGASSCRLQLNFCKFAFWSNMMSCSHRCDLSCRTCSCHIQSLQITDALGHHKWFFTSNASKQVIVMLAIVSVWTYPAGTHPLDINAFCATCSSNWLLRREFRLIK
jgi:hypothetical protein